MEMAQADQCAFLSTCSMLLQYAWYGYGFAGTTTSVRVLHVSQNCWLWSPARSMTMCPSTQLKALCPGRHRSNAHGQRASAKTRPKAAPEPAPMNTTGIQMGLLTSIQMPQAQPTTPANPPPTRFAAQPMNTTGTRGSAPPTRPPAMPPPTVEMAAWPSMPTLPPLALRPWRWIRVESVGSLPASCASVGQRTDPWRRSTSEEKSTGRAWSQRKV